MSSSPPRSGGAGSPRVPGSGAGAGTGGPAVQASRQSTVVRLGVIYLKGLNAAYKSAGAKSATTDSQADYAAVINDINVHGGIAGRRVLPYYYAIDAASATAPADQLQAVHGLRETERIADDRHRRRDLDDTLKRRRPVVQMPLGQAMLEHPEVVEKPE